MWCFRGCEILKPFHRHGVCEDDALKPDVLAEQGVDDGRGEGGRLPRRAVEGGNVQVSSHHGAYPGLGHGAEWHQFHAVQPRPVMRNRRQGQMGICIRIAMAWKMLGRGQNATILQPQCHRDAESADQIRRLAEGSVADDGIVRIRVDIDHRGKIHVNADRPQLAGHLLADFSGQSLVIRRPEGHRPRPAARGIQPHPQPPLCIGRGPHRQWRRRLQSVDALALQDGPALHADDPADAIFPCPGLCFCPILAARLRIHRGHQQLGNLPIK